MPVASNLNFSANETVPNLVAVKVGTSGQVSVFNNSGTADIIVDVVGYFGSSGGAFVPLTPRRLVDSRDGTGGYSTPWGGGTSRSVGLTGGTTTVPSNATALVVNLTGVLPSSATHISAWPAGQTMPVASNLNLPAGDVRANLAVLAVGPLGQVSVFNNSGTVNLVIDVDGYFT